MKIVACLAVFAVVAGSCHNMRGKISEEFADRTIEYQSAENEYSVVVVETEGLTVAGAKKIAEIKAAEMAHEDGYRYITLEKTEATEVVETSQSWPDDRAFYGNMYQELIIEGDFGRDRATRERIPSENIYPAYRFVFKASDTKTSWRAIDVCTLTDCS